MAPILIVDDEGGVRKVFASILQDEGYPVLTAANGDQALEIVAIQRPGLILLDLVMPEMDGCQFMAQYKQLPGPHAPVILATAVRNPADAACRAGVDSFLPKPFDIEDLLTLVAHFMRSPGGDGPHPTPGETAAP